MQFQQPFTYFSVCDGIGAAHVAWTPLGWRCVGMSEIDDNARAVLRYHYPNVPLHGDFTKLIADPPDADALCGGTPCQAFSIAGLREGLADDRGNLTLQFVLLANAIDALRRAAGKPPIWIIWENVPGVLSTNDNAFGNFLGALCGTGAPILPPKERGKPRSWYNAGVVDGPERCAAWRVLDAQHFGLAQRRKRVFLVARAGAGKWAVADALLPLIAGRDWHPAPSREARQGTAPTLAARTTAGGGLGTDAELAGSLIATDPKVDVNERPSGSKNSQAPLVMAHGQKNAEIVSDGEPSLTCNHEPPILIRMREGRDGGGKGPLYSEDQSLTLATANDQVLAFSLRGREEGAQLEVSSDGNVSALRAASGGSTRDMVAYNIHGTPATLGASETDIHAALRARAPGGSEASTTTVLTFQGNASATNSMNPGTVAPTMDRGKANGLMVAVPIAWDEELNPSEDIAGTMIRGGDGGRHAGVMQPIDPIRYGGSQQDTLHDASGVLNTLPAGTNNNAGSYTKTVDANTHVRRLTPRECERLQGFPDDYTLVPSQWFTFRHAETPRQFRRRQFHYVYVEKSEPMADGPRYKMCGNSWATHVARYVGEQIERVRQAEWNIQHAIQSLM